jgi:hypothetical protein
MAWNNEIEAEKDLDGAKEYTHGDKKLLGVNTSRSKLDELWSLLEYKMIVSDHVEELLKAKGLRRKAQRSEVKAELTSYILQSKNFYTYAINADYRSSPLLYYYAFMNLAKAIIILNNTEYAGKKFHHGLCRHNKVGELQSRSCSVLSPGRPGTIMIFGELYNSLYNTQIPPSTIVSFESILGYITDISHEVSRLPTAIEHKVHPARYFHAFSKSRKKSWIVLITEKFYPAKYPASFEKFEQEFVRFTPSAFSLEYIFGIKVKDAHNYDFSHSKKEFDLDEFDRLAVGEARELLKSVLGNNTQNLIFDDNGSFAITYPLTDSSPIAFNEMLSTYLIVFYLSEIVRYNPYELDDQFSTNTTEGWVVKSLIESAAYTCLVNMIATITGDVYIIKSR